MQLNNGSVIMRIDVHRADPSPTAMLVGKALAYRQGMAHEAFVTWSVGSDDDGETFEAFGGHYFDNFNDASRDFESR